MFSPQILDHFEHPRNSGSIPDPDASVQLQNPACGDVLQLTLKLADDRIAEIRFLAKGCVPCIACASAITELVRSKTIADARAVSREQLIDAVGGLPPASSHASHLAIDALHASLDQLSRQNRSDSKPASGTS